MLFKPKLYTNKRGEKIRTKKHIEFYIQNPT
jgi:hypothetical protein